MTHGVRELIRGHAPAIVENGYEGVLAGVVQNLDSSSPGRNAVVDDVRDSSFHGVPH